RGRIELARSLGVGHAAIHNGTNHFLSTFRDQASILMSVHSVTPRIAKVWQHQRSRFGPNGQPPESSHLARDSGSRFPSLPLKDDHAEVFRAKSGRSSNSVTGSE